MAGESCGDERQTLRQAQGAGRGSPRTAPAWAILTMWFQDQHGKAREEPIEVAVAHVVSVTAAEGPPRKPPGASVCLTDGRRLSVVEDRVTVMHRLTGCWGPDLGPSPLADVGASFKMRLSADEIERHAMETQGPLYWMRRVWPSIFGGADDGKGEEA